LRQNLADVPSAAKRSRRETIRAKQVLDEFRAKTNAICSR
jgi:hypothetical protein